MSENPTAGSTVGDRAPFGSLVGKVALVPGASGGIGRAVAEVLAERGAKLMLGYNSNAEPVEKLAERLRAVGGEVMAAQLDASNETRLAEWVGQAHAKFGSIDILANCLGWQGTTPTFQPFAEQKPEFWLKVIEIELLAALRLAQAVVPHMRAQGFGRIITVGSDSSKVGESGAAANAAARGGCNAFSKSLAREVGRYGITVNTVCPGPTDTPLLSQLASMGSGDKMVAKMTSLTALKRIGTPREVANVVAFLASDEASYVTGQAVSVSGGLTMC